MTRIRVLVADDSELYRSGVAAILGAADGIEVVAEAADGREAVELSRRARPDVALIDLRMPVMDGTEAIRELSRIHATCRCVVLTTFDDDRLIFEALRAGAVGYLLKDVSAEALVDGVRKVAAGEAVLTPSVTTRVLAEFVRMTPTGPTTQLPALSRREREVLSLIGRGSTNKEIATALSIAVGTVKNHVTSVLDKLGVDDRTRAALVARDLGLL